MVRKTHVLYRAARKKTVVVYLSVAVSIIAITAFMKTNFIDNDVFDSLAVFQDFIFSEKTSAEPETPNEEALLDAVGEKLTAHSIAE